MWDVLRIVGFLSWLLICGVVFGLVQHYIGGAVGAVIALVITLVLVFGPATLRQTIKERTQRRT
jgi:hypothetical protein